MGDIDRMLNRLEENDQTEAELARRLGVRHQVVYNWKARGKIPGDRLTDVAKFLRVNTDWLKTGNGPKERTREVKEEGGFYNVEPGPKIQGQVPEISWVQAGEAEEAVDLYEPGDGKTWVETTVQVRRHTYALRVQGDSMLPRFPPGIRIIVEPEMDAEAGDYVIAKNGDSEVTFKQLVKEGGDWYLKPLNPQYPVKPLDGWVVIGVVREAVERFK